MDIQATYEGVTYNIVVAIADALTGNANDITHAGGSTATPRDKPRNGNNTNTPPYPTSSRSY